MYLGRLLVPYKEASGRLNPKADTSSVGPLFDRPKIMPKIPFSGQTDRSAIKHKNGHDLKAHLKRKIENALPKNGAGVIPDLLLHHKAPETLEPAGWDKSTIYAPNSFTHGLKKVSAWPSMPFDKTVSDPRGLPGQSNMVVERPTISEAELMPADTPVMETAGAAIMPGAGAFDNIPSLVKYGMIGLTIYYLIKDKK
jgi:hypothetical protein